MASVTTNLATLLLGVLLAATGGGKAFGRQAAGQAAGTVLVRVLNDGRRATRVLRATGAVDVPDPEMGGESFADGGEEEA